MTSSEIKGRLDDAQNLRNEASKKADHQFKVWQDTDKTVKEFDAEIIVLTALQEKSNEAEQRAFAEGLARGKNIDLNKHAAKLSEIVTWFVNQDKQ